MMKQDIASSLVKNFDDVFDKLENFDKFYNRGETNKKIKDCKTICKYILDEVISDKSELELKKNLEKITDYTLKLINSEEGPIFDNSPKKPSYNVLKRKIKPKINIIEKFTYKENMMKERKFNGKEFYSHNKYPDGIWTTKLKEGKKYVFTFPSKDGYYYMDEYYSYKSYPYSKNIPDDIMLKKYKIDDVYQCWKTPDL